MRGEPSARNNGPVSVEGCRARTRSSMGESQGGDRKELIVGFRAVLNAEGRRNTGGPPLLGDGASVVEEAIETGCSGGRTAMSGSTRCSAGTLTR